MGDRQSGLMPRAPRIEYAGFMKTNIYWIDTFIGVNGNAYAQINRTKLLAEMIPSRTQPAGANPVQKFFPLGGEDRNFDMNNKFQNGWPSERGNNKRWLHSDAREVAYLYIHKLYEKFVELGGLK